MAFRVQATDASDTPLQTEEAGWGLTALLAFAYSNTVGQTPPYFDLSQRCHTMSH